MRLVFAAKVIAAIKEARDGGAPMNAQIGYGDKVGRRRARRCTGLGGALAVYACQAGWRLARRAGRVYGLTKAGPVALLTGEDKKGESGIVGNEEKKVTV